MTGNKDREWAVALGEGLSRAGFDALRFSFAGNGASEGDFGASCPTKEAGDLGSVIDALGDRDVVYVGHSMGAAVGVLRASRDERIRALVSLAGMVETAAFVERKFAELVPGRDVMWDKPDCPLSQAFVDDMRGIGSVEGLAARVKVPWLLVHGTADPVVPLEESERIRERAGGSAQLVLLEGVDHVFTGAIDELVRSVRTWLERLFAG